MAGPAGGSNGGTGWYRPMYGFHPHRPAFHHRFGAKLLGGTMLFWILYRGYHDGAVVLGLKHPWDGHHGHHGDHGHGEGEEHH